MADWINDLLKINSIPTREDAANESVIKRAQTAIRKQTAILDFPPGYEAGRYKFRFDADGPRLVDGEQGHPYSVNHPLGVAVDALMLGRLKECGLYGKNVSQAIATEAAAKANHDRAQDSPTRQAIKEYIQGLIADKTPGHKWASRILEHLEKIGMPSTRPTVDKAIKELGYSKK